MTPADLPVDIVPIVRSIAGKRRDRSRNLLKQGTDLRAVIGILAGQLGGDDLSRVGVDADMELPPGPTRLGGVLLDQPLTLSAERDRWFESSSLQRRVSCEPDFPKPEIARDRGHSAKSGDQWFESGSLQR